MAIDTLAYAKHLEQAGVARAQAEALRAHIVPDLATRDDIVRIEQRFLTLEQQVNASEARVIAEVQRAVAALHGYGLRLAGVVVAALALLFALLRWA
jgi:hypothetical protein